jgi:23S rRNA pseudouridine1911/1915/1917 synthase
MPLKVLYEDNHLIAVVKLAGVLTQGDKTGDISLMDEVKDYLKEKYKKPGNVFLGLLHRLDRPVSGIILFAKTSKGASRLSEQFRKREIKKIYHAIVLGKMEKSAGVLINYLRKDEKTKKAEIADEVEGQLSELSYETISSTGKYSLLKIQIKTGRFHQIRAQLAAAGHPILGDVKYYGAQAPFPDKSIALASTSLSFMTATTKELEELAIPIPGDWQKFVKR